MAQLARYSRTRDTIYTNAYEMDKNEPLVEDSGRL